MNKLDQAAYESLVRGANVLTRDSFGDKVLELPDGRILKLFRAKRLFSSNTLFPFATRFARAARRLAERKIPTLEVLAVYSIPSIRRQGVLYRKVTGQPLRSLLEQGSESASLISLLAQQLALLHARGIYFRSVHFANLLLTPDQQLALIDVLETRFSRHSLRPKLRSRNFRHLTRYEVDRAALTAFGLERFLQEYLAASDLSARHQARLLACLARGNRFFGEAASRQLTALGTI